MLGDNAPAFSIEVDAWFIINRAIDLTFICDIFFQFFIMYPVPPKQDPREKRQYGGPIGHFRGLMEGIPAILFPVSDKHVRQVREDNVPYFTSQTGHLYIASHGRIAWRCA